MRDTIGGLLIIILGVAIVFLGSLPFADAGTDRHVSAVVMCGSWVAGALAFATGLLSCVAGALFRPKGRSGSER